MTDERSRLFHMLADAIERDQCGDIWDIIGFTEQEHARLPALLRSDAAAPDDPEALARNAIIFIALRGIPHKTREEVINSPTGKALAEDARIWADAVLRQEEAVARQVDALNAIRSQENPRWDDATVRKLFARLRD